MPSLHPAEFRGLQDQSSQGPAVMIATRVIDRAFLDSIAQGVQDRAYGRVRNLEVEDRGQSIVLTGLTRSYYIKQLALHGALDLVDDRVVENRIQVV
jgi:hypothetical protein